MKNFRVINLEKYTDRTKYEKEEDGIYRKLDDGTQVIALFFEYGNDNRENEELTLKTLARYYDSQIVDIQSNYPTGIVEVTSTGGGCYRWKELPEKSVYLDTEEVWDFDGENHWIEYYVRIFDERSGK
jgi:hypothetical protein